MGCGLSKTTEEPRGDESALPRDLDDAGKRTFSKKPNQMPTICQKRQRP